VTKQISALEQELGFSLFNRLPNGVSLTPAGHIIYDCLRNFDQDLAASVQRARELNKAGGYLSFGLLTGMNLFPLQERIRHFADSHANLLTDVLRGSVEQLVSGLFSGSTDLAVFFDYHIKRIEGLSFMNLYPSRHVIVVSRNHPLAGKASVTPEDLSQYPFIFSFGYGAENRTGSFSQIAEIGREIGICTDSVQYCPNFESVFTQQEIRNGISFMDQNVIYLERQHFITIPTNLPI
jgi:DNA-binding transcriptional LysR family regulator